MKGKSIVQFYKFLHTWSTSVHQGIKPLLCLFSPYRVFWLSLLLGILDLLFPLLLPSFLAVLSFGAIEVFKMHLSMVQFSIFFISWKNIQFFLTLPFLLPSLHVYLATEWQISSLQPGYICSHFLLMSRPYYDKQWRNSHYSKKMSRKYPFTPVF